MTAVQGRRADAGEAQEDLDHRAEKIREATDFESMRGLLGELPPGIFPPKSEEIFRRRRRDR